MSDFIVIGCSTPVQGDPNTAEIIPRNYTGDITEISPIPYISIRFQTQSGVSRYLVTILPERQGAFINFAIIDIDSTPAIQPGSSPVSVLARVGLGTLQEICGQSVNQSTSITVFANVQETSPNFVIAGDRYTIDIGRTFTGNIPVASPTPVGNLIARVTILRSKNPLFTSDQSTQGQGGHFHQFKMGHRHQLRI